MVQGSVLVRDGILPVVVILDVGGLNALDVSFALDLHYVGILEERM